MHGQRWRSGIFVLLLLLVLAPGGPAWAQAAPATATVTVLHALPAFTADVYVNGELTLSGFEPETATDPLELPAGRYTLEIRDVGAAPDSEPALEGTVRLKAGQNLSIIAGLTEDGDPALNVYANDLSQVQPGRARLIVRNVADARAFGVELDGDVVLKRVPNSGESATQLREGEYAFEATIAGESAIGPEDLLLEEGTAGIVYVLGSADEGTFDLMFQTIPGLQGAPTSVFAGDGGLATSPGLPAWATASMLLGVLGLVGSVAVLIRRRAAPDRFGLS
ncbi:MAG: DUF4397 domain-containing protein [Candidatus Rokuibacteriota bacterium]